jgi:hypothetical protein
MRLILLLVDFKRKITSSNHWEFFPDTEPMHGHRETSWTDAKDQMSVWRCMLSKGHTRGADYSQKLILVPHKMTGVKIICENVETTQRLYCQCMYVVDEHTCKTALRFSKAHVCLRKEDLMADENNYSSFFIEVCAVWRYTWCQEQHIRGAKSNTHVETGDWWPN